MSTTQDARKKFTIAKAQENLYSRNTANVVCDVDTSKTGTVYNPFTSKGAVSDGTATVAYPVAAYTADADSLQINRRATFAEHIDSYDDISVDFGLVSDRGMNAGKSISQRIDGFTFNAPVGVAGITAIDAGDFGGTDGAPYTSSNTVIDDIINVSLTELFVQDAEDKKFMLVSPFEAGDLRSYLQASGNNVMDEVIRNGIPSAVTKVGTTFSGVDVFMTNNLTNEVVLTMATNPANGDTITFAGVTYTFLATLTGGAGEIHITASVDATRANLAEAITGVNFPGDTAEAEGTNTGYSALSADDQAKLSRLGVVAVNSNSEDTLTITCQGTFKVSETLTDGSDVFGLVYRYLIIGDYGSINLYMPSQGMDYKEIDVSGKHGQELKMSQLYNATVWSKMKDRLATVKVN